MRASRCAAAFAAGLLGGLLLLAAARAYVPIMINGKQLGWSSPTIAWSLHSAGSDDLPDGSHEFAVEQAFSTWEAAAGSKIAFTRGSDVANGPGTATHVVMFDETGETGYFPNGSGIVALTPISYDTGSGAILDADVIFNAKDYSWSVTGAAGAFDVQDVLTHELGHFIGLDHSPSVSGTMWPYVSTTQWLHRSLAPDDRNGAVAQAPQGTPSKLTGIVRRAGTPVPGAAVHAIRAADGRYAGSALTAPNGIFDLRGLPAGDYYVYAAPLEGGMNAANLTGNGAVSTAFAPSFLGSFAAPTVVTVAAAATTNLGNLNVPADRTLTETSAAPVILRRGDTQAVTVFGTGFEAGAMSFVVKSPFLSVANVTSGTTWARADVTVGIGAPYGSYDVYVRDSSGFFEAASGLIDVVADPPTLIGVSAPSLSAGGGLELTLTGADFQDGCAVLFGGFEAAAVDFQDADTLVVTTPVAEPGAVDVSVHNPDGQHDVLQGAFNFTAQPIFQQLFPTAGHADGGTPVLIHGASFAPDVVVQLDGTPLAVEYLGATLLRVLTPAHAFGVVDLLLRNPGEPDTTVADAFEFVATPDPRILSFTPDKGPKAGGTRVRLSGVNLGEIVEVRFGANAVSALGGKLAVSLDVISAGAVEATTTAQPAAGTYSIVARTANGQGASTSGFTFESPANPGGGGVDLPGAGGCGGVIGGRADPRSARGELLAFALALAAWRLSRRLRRPAPAPTR